MDDDSRMSETSSVRNRGQRHALSTMGDLDGAGDAASLSASHIRPQLRCNSCWEPILPDAQSAETCYRTSCGHLFCEKCAYKHFGQGRLQCPACSADLSQGGGGISETTIHGVADPKRTEAIWEEMMADPSSCFEHFQQALDFILFQLAQDSYSRQEEIRRQQSEEQKTFQIQHGEKYIQLKNYTDQLEAELRETKSKMQALTTSNDELREAYKEKSRKCRNWEKMCKTLKSQPNARQFPSPTRSTMGMPQQEGGTLLINAQPDGEHGKARDPTRHSKTKRGHVRAVFETSNRRLVSTYSAAGRPEKPDRATEDTATSFSEGWLSLKKTNFSDVRGVRVVGGSDTCSTAWNYFSRCAIQRAKPLFELSDAAIEISHCHVKKTRAKVALPAPVERSVPFDFETILEAVDCPPADRLGSSSSHAALTNLSLELADYEELFTDSTMAPRYEDGRRHSRRKSVDTVEPYCDATLSASSSGATIVLAPLKAPPQRMQSAPRVAQRYQLRHPDQLIAEATERRRLADEILELENHRRRKEEELASIYKREKEAEAQRAHGLKIIRTYTAPKNYSKKTRVCEPPFTSELLLQHHGRDTKHYQE
ncbi:hypothetical protein PF010_g15369 [Phytophthora fragariae]|uniref:RING-type domain-containing protein n=1 Tax=Phytophthora fragariae TaxID=53985 RepID=A0A6A3YCA8_9STRA|nr:hypothetical protein PF010_g15369 [Phytophthora fragariae]KAE9215590.1 hypothetical protein PF002_g17323 [Phytophthora fragariae]